MLLWQKNDDVRDGVDRGGVAIRKDRVRVFAVLALSLGALATAGAAAVSAIAETRQYAPSMHQRLDDRLSARLKDFLRQVHQSDAKAYRLAAGSDDNPLAPSAPAPKPAENNGGDNLSVTADGTFAFATPLASGASATVRWL